MLSREDNELVTRTGPGTPLGEAMRRYWMPALMSSELPEADCPPTRIGLLGEKLVAFRDSNGEAGLVAENCPHRGASLFFGRNEEEGLRCVYHGWKFNTEGVCVDMPNEPPESNFKQKVKVTAYPCIEMGGIIWTYMGPPDRRPPEPGYEWVRAPEGCTFVSKTFEDCNYLQGVEGGVDSSHSSFLHREFGNNPSLGANSYRARAGAPRLEVLRTDYGYSYASIRHIKDEDKNFVRVYQFVMPFHQQRAFFGYLSKPVIQGHMWVPIDDYTHWVWNWMYVVDGTSLSEEEIELEERMTGRHPDDMIPGTFKLKKNRENDYMMSRERQKTVNYTGIEGVNTQDLALQETMGTIYDRTKEHLGASDLAVITTRRLLLQAIKEVQDGDDPIGAMSTSSHHVRAGEMLMPAEANWHETIKGELVAKW
jgi:phenylpropionate dioxygenase-like ring-hydroxylating dioxygenase large terminal subunit